MEQSSLEQQRASLIQEINTSTIRLLEFAQKLLAKLNECTGNLIDDDSLIQTLRDTKAKAADIQRKKKIAEETTEQLDKRRKQYAMIANRGAVLYFVAVDLPLINFMYQTSLNQFLVWFDYAIMQAPKDPRIPKRVQNITEFLTFHVYRYVIHPSLLSFFFLPSFLLSFFRFFLSFPSFLSLSLSSHFLLLAVYLFFSNLVRGISRC